MGEKLERLCLDVAFTSLGVRELFMSCTSSKKRIKICSMEESGRFQGEVIMNGDDHMQRPSSLSTDSNVEHQLCQKQQVMRSPVTIPPSITEEGENDLTEESDNQHQLVEHTSDVKDVMVTGLVGNKKGQAASDNINAKSNVDDPPQLVNSHTNNPEIITEEIDNVEGSTPCTYQPQHDEQTHLHEPSNAPDGDVELSTVDSSSHSHLSSSKQPHHTTNSVYTYQPQQDKQTYLPEPANAPDDDVNLSTVDSSSRSHVSSSKQSHHTTISEHKASDSGTTNAATVGLESNKIRTDHEQREKRRHTVHCLLHGIEKEHYKYDEMFASELKKFLNREPNTVPPTESEDDDYMWYIEDHLKNKQCPSFCAQLWKFCTANNLCNLYKYADAGLLLYSKSREDKVGSICTDFADLESMEIIGRGGFGIVYLYTSPSGEQLAIKKEIKHPLIDANPKLFNQILKLKNPHVIETLEYLVAGQDDKKSYLLVTPFMNRKGLDEQFKKKIGCGSVLTYMKKYPGQKKFIFRNFLEIFHQVFEALDYLKTQRLVHRDVKSSNILVQQKCQCDSPLMCTCLEGNTIHCVLGDMNLLCNEGESSLITSEMWHRMVYEPAGTPRMKAPESYYRTGEGDPVISHKSDVWSGCVTMINALVGREVNDVPDTQIDMFMRTATQTVGNASKDIDSCSSTLGDIIKKFAAKAENMNPLVTELQALHKRLDKSSKALKKVQAFQGGVPEARDKGSPLAGILFTVYVANNLHWKCLTTLPHVYNTPLWDCICGTLAIITDGVRFIPENRKDASEIVGLLKPIKAAVMS